MLLDLFPTLLIGVCALAGGAALLHRWGAPTVGERLVLAWALGFALHGTLTLLVGLWRFDRWTLATVDVTLLLVGARPLWRLVRSLFPALGAMWATVRASRLQLALLLALLVFALLNVLGAATVPLDGDALRYHLAAPQHWLRAGAIGLTLGIPYASFPLLAQMSYAHALAFGALAAPALLHALWAAMLAVGVFVSAAHGSRVTGQGTEQLLSPQSSMLISLLAALLFLSLTDVSAEAKLPRADLAVGLWGWGAAWCWVRWRNPSPLPHRNARRGKGVRITSGWLLCSGLLAGAATAGKYTGLIAAIVTGVLILYDVVRGRARWTAPLLFAACAALIAAPWYIKNGWFTGNPVFPFAASLFGGPLPQEVLAENAAVVGNYAPIQRTPLNFVLSPLLLVFAHGQFASGRIGPLWLLLPLVLLVRSRPGETHAMLVWGLLFAPFWFWTSPLVRFAFPVFALWSPLLAVTLHSLTNDERDARSCTARRVIRSSCQLVTVVWLLFAGASSVSRTLPALPVALGVRAPGAVLAAAPRVDGPYSYADLQRATAVEGPLIVFDSAGFYIARSVTLAGDLGGDPVSLLDARYTGANCGVVSFLLPDKLTPGLDAWVAARVRPWIARHQHAVVYRRGEVALYRVDGCAR